MNRRQFAQSLTTGAAALALGAPSAFAQSPASIRDAFLYGFAPYEMARLAARATTTGTGFNRFGHRSTLSDHTARTVTTPNNDTLYSSAWIDLSGGPVEVFAPSVLGRYFSVAFMSAFTDNFRIIGTRATGGRGGRFWIVGPGYRGAAPAGVELIRSPTTDLWALARILVDGPSDLEAAKAVQQRFTMTPVTADPLIPRRVAPTSASDAHNFLGVVNESLWRSRHGTGPASRASRYRATGLGPVEADTWEAMPEVQRVLWQGTITQTLAELKAGFARKGHEVDGWLYPAANTGDFGDDDAYRAQVALSGLGALPPEEAVYLSADRDASGAELNGASRYVFSLPAGGAPVDAFWSLSMYEPDADGRLFFVDNPVRRFAIGNRTEGLKVNADGSMAIMLSADQPDDTSNWLPAPRGPFRVTFRAYLPRANLRNGRWTLPPLAKI
ncbi:MAG: DUF1254 domain-containing protein [Hyphomonadaceae bacterium]|nr:MAG: phosphatidylserine decarboxylase [Caulobacteraceae bacterium]MBT9447104.1 DUF1254 domain-containing protein [Hyphomonadaceae bacterium]TPW02581.1 MAG: phosphatidylserine decarboxylase [Alphaproteobacteria bacterium]